MIYIKIRFTKGLECEAYQKIDPQVMVCIGYVDLQGNDIELPEVTESIVIDPEPKKDLF